MPRDSLTVERGVVTPVYVINLRRCVAATRFLDWKIKKKSGGNALTHHTLKNFVGPPLPLAKDG